MVWVSAFLLIVIAAIDLKTRRIPDVLSGSIAFIGLIQVHSMFGFELLAWRKGFVSALTVFCLMLVVAVVSSGSVGGGDIKLATALSVPVGAMGYEHLILAWLVIGGSIFVIAFVLLVSKKTLKTAIPFGPSLALGYLLAMV